VARLRASHSYRFVLLLIIGAFAFTAWAPDERWATAVQVAIGSATLVVAVWTSGLERDVRWFVRPVVAICLLGALGQLGFEHDVGASSLNLILVAGAVVAIAIGVVDQGEVNAQSVLGAICVYLLLGMFFASLYGAVAVFGAGPFFAQGTDGTGSTRQYFSYVTLATLGYGDFTPAGTLGRSLAVWEALLGQLYLVTVVALLVGNLGGRRRAAAAPAAPGDVSRPLTPRDDLERATP
jgi:hypothetical protein